MRIILASGQFAPARSGYSTVATNLFHEFEHAGHSVEIITEGKGCRRIGKVFTLTPDARRMIRSGVDIVQIIGPSPLFTEQLVKVATSSGTISSYNLFAFAGLSTYYGGPLSKLVDTLYVHTLLSRALRHAGVLIVPTHDFARSLGPLQSKCAVIPLGVADPCLTGPTTIRTPGDGPGTEILKVLFVGQLRRYKGIPVLLNAVALLKTSGRRLRLTIVGEGPDRPVLERTVGRLGIKENVIFRGALDDTALHTEYLSNDVLVLPSLFGESFGLVLVEAALHGLKVVASDLAGVREVVRDLGGSLIPVGDAKALGGTLGDLSPLRPEDRRLVPSITSRYSWPQVAARYVEAYRQAARRPSG